MNIASVATSGTGASTAAGLSGVSGNDFMQILVKQLQYQDPFEPMGNQEMVSQIANIRELEMNTRLSQRLEQLTDQQRFGSAAALIGKYAKGEMQAGDGSTMTVEGVITGLRFTPQGEVILELDTGEVLPLAALVRVTDMKNATASGQTEADLPAAL